MTTTIEQLQQERLRLEIPTRRPVGFWEDAFRRLIKNRASVIGGIVLLVIVLLAVFADVVAPFPYDKQFLSPEDKANTVPTWLLPMLPPNTASYAKVSNEFLLGSDTLGRDLWSRLVYGARISLLVGFIGAMTAIILGVTYGSICGFFGGMTDTLMVAFIDIMYAFPTILLIILMMVYFRSALVQVDPDSFQGMMKRIDDSMGGLFFIFIGIGITAWMGQARLVRGQMLSLKRKEFIEAAHTIGATNSRIIVRHLLPNVLGPVIVAGTLSIPGYISSEAFLSFIGLGVNPPTPSWGTMINDGRTAMLTYPHQIIFPGIALALVMLAFNFLGDGLRDAMDPRMRGAN
ncbi:MAG: ABC transporter permease [Chloroflexi bacterium]|nr:ABC transporter permease [Chloroflexota bacterium]